METEEKNLSLNAHREKQQRPLPELRLRKLILALWERMTNLYGHKWMSQEGPHTMENGSPSTAYLLWCRKLENLSEDDFARGFKQIEFLVKEAARQGDELWPPSYAGFIGYCEKPHGEIAYRYFPRLGLTNKTKRERDRIIALEKIKEIRSILD